MDELKKIIQLPEVKKIFKAFGESSIFLVGGCVRDTLMNKSVTDIDFATPCEPDSDTHLTLPTTVIV